MSFLVGQDAAGYFVDYDGDGYRDEYDGLACLVDQDGNGEADYWIVIHPEGLAPDYEWRDDDHDFKVDFNEMKY